MMLADVSQKLPNAMLITKLKKVLLHSLYSLWHVTSCLWMPNAHLAYSAQQATHIFTLDTALTSYHFCVQCCQ